MPHLSPDDQVRRVARWRGVLVAGALTATLGVVGLVGAQVASADTEPAQPAVVSGTTSSDQGSTTTDQGSSSGWSDPSGLSAGSSSSHDATSSGS